jgi:predicted Zn-dependent protease with MMP-like domain
MPRTRKAFDAFVDRAIARLPEDLRNALNDIELIVDDEPDPELLKRPGKRPFSPDLLGFFTGTALPDHSFFNPIEWPARIYLFRLNILDSVDTPKELEEEIYLTLFHEIGHAIGLDEKGLKDRGLS